MSEHQLPESSAVRDPRSRPNSPKKKVSFNQLENEDATALSSVHGNMKSTPNARNSTSLNPRYTASTAISPEQYSQSPSRRRQSSIAVQKEIDSLQPLTPEGARPVWAPGNTELMSQNLETLLRAARYTPESRGAMVPATPNTAQTPTGSLSKKTKKRPREDDSDDEYKENKTPTSNIRRATRSTTAAARRPIVKPIKPLPLNHVVQVEPKIDLAKLAPQPLRISYKPHPLEDRSDAWYTEMFRRLFRQTDKFATRYFGVHDLDAGEFFEPWAAGMTGEFITWAEQVAESDPNLGTGSWDDLLRDTMQRKWLVMGILMKIVRVKIFEVDLFGAGKEQAELLHGLSRAFVGREGFGRQALRAETVRTIIGRNAVTENFYSSVATLTAQISLLLKPLTDYLYGMQPRFGIHLPKIEDQYQALHNLVSTAAYISLCIKLSPTIFTFNDVSPGTFYDETDHYSLENRLYLDSQEAVLTDHRLQLEIFLDRRAHLNAALDTLIKAGKRDTRAGIKADAALAAHETKVPTPVDRDYRAMCKIGVWPVVTRYKPGQDEDDEKGECSRFLREKDGFRVLQLARGAVVCYYGWNRRDVHGRLELNPAGERTGLRCWVRGKTEEGGLGGRGKVVAGLGAAVVGVMMVGGLGMLSDSFPAVQGMDYIEAGRFFACEVLSVCHT